jgi:hypothetical protein
MNMRILHPGVTTARLIAEAAEKARSESVLKLDGQDGIDLNGHEVAGGDGALWCDDEPVGQSDGGQGEGMNLGSAVDYFGGVVQDLVSALSEIDERIKWVDRMLDELQPVQSGRLRVLWVGRQNRGFEGEKEPVVVAWRRNNKTGKWLGERVPNKNLARRASGRGEFEKTKPQVVQALGQLSELFEIRQSVRGRLTTLDADWSRSKGYLIVKVRKMDEEIRRLRVGASAEVVDRHGQEEGMMA